MKSLAPPLIGTGVVPSWHYTKLHNRKQTYPDYCYTSKQERRKTVGYLVNTNSTSSKTIAGFYTIAGPLTAEIKH